MPKDYEPEVLVRLLDLQAEDSAVARLNHELATLPEARRLEETSARLSELEADYDIARKQADEIAREQARLEQEVASVDAKLAREERRLFSGDVANPKELSVLQAEVESLKRRRGELEDALLEVMVGRDDAAQTARRLADELQEVKAQAEELSVVVGEARARIGAELSRHTARREEIAASLPDELLSLYDGLRVQKGGVGAAALLGDTCQGCHTKLPAKEVERLRAEGGLQRCDNCRRILVVTR